MARRTIDHTVQSEGRDFGKTFVVTEMPAEQGEAWGIKILLAMSRSGVELPEDVARMGLAGVAQLGLRALSAMRWEDAQPILAEMMACVQMRPDPTKPLFLRAIMAGEIEEIATRVELREEVWKLHLGFFTAVTRLISSLAGMVRGI